MVHILLLPLATDTQRSTFKHYFSELAWGVVSERQIVCIYTVVILDWDRAWPRYCGSSTRFVTCWAASILSLFPPPQFIHFPASCQQHRHGCPEQPHFSYLYVTLYLSVISCLSSLLLSSPVCSPQTGRSPRWPCCWGGRPSPSSPSWWRWSLCASAPGVAVTSLWLSCFSLQVGKERKETRRKNWMIKKCTTNVCFKTIWLFGKILKSYYFLYIYLFCVPSLSHVLVCSGAPGVQLGSVSHQVHWDGHSKGVSWVQLGLRPGLGIYHLLFWRSYPLLPQPQELWRLLLKYTRKDEKLRLAFIQCALGIRKYLLYSAQPQARKIGIKIFVSFRILKRMLPVDTVNF